MFDFLSSTFSSIFSTIRGSGTLSQKNIQDLCTKVKEALLEADVPYAVTEDFITSLQRDHLGKKVLKGLKPEEQFMKAVYDTTVEFLGGQASILSFDIPSCILVMGLQGSGKTTTIAKLARFFKEQAKEKGKKRTILLASVDFYRPAALDQLEQLSKRADVHWYRAKSHKVPEAAREIYTYFRENQFDYLLLDTAGRMHIDDILIKELKDIVTIIQPRYKVLVIDAMIGQESLHVAQGFDKAVGFGSAILTKMDSETRGGVAFAFKYSLKKPIAFVGTGEALHDLESFRPERMASRILGMGDIVSLAETAQKKITLEQQKNVEKAFNSGRMTLQDFADQLHMMSQLGSLQSLMKYIPGASSVQVTPETLSKGEEELKKFRAILASMTSKERNNHTILNTSRKNRIAKGAGVSVSDVDGLLAKFEQSQQFVKLFKRMGSFSSFFKGR